MNILISGASTRIARLLASELGRDHSVTVTDRIHVAGVDNFVRCDLSHDQATNDLVRGMDVIVHSGHVDLGVDMSAQLDGGTRCVYNLLWAAVEERVPRLVFLSDLSVVDAYDEDYAVTERWRPVPSTKPDILCFHLGEFICREFARERRIEAVCLRLGSLTPDDKAPASSSTLYESDAVQAVRLALTADISEGYAGSRSYFGLFHVQSTVPGQRFLTIAAETTLGLDPAKR